MAGAQIAMRADEFDTIEAETVRKQIADLPDHEDLMSADVELPATYLFKTRDGAIGVLQITEVQRDAPAHLKIRYKLVAGSSTQPSPAK